MWTTTAFLVSLTFSNASIKEAISLANESKRHGSGCIGFINTVIRKANGGIANNKSTHLIDGCGGWDASTINGLSVSSSVKNTQQMQ